MSLYESTLGSLAAFSPEILILGAALLLMLIEFFFKRQTERLPIFGAAALLYAVWSSIEVFCSADPVIPRLTAFEGAVVHDGWTVLFRVIAMVSAGIALITALPRGAFLASEEQEHRVRYASQGEFSILILLSAIGVTFLAASTDFLVTLLALEIMSLPLYAMLTLSGGRQSYEAAVKYFLMGAVASAFMLFGLSILLTSSGTTRFAGLSLGNSYQALGFILFVAGLLFKAAVVPFHAWMPDAYQTTPAPLGIFMAAAVKAGAFAALGRLMAIAIPVPETMLQVTMILAALTMFMGNGSALAQTSLTRLLGYSSIAHTGFLLMGIDASIQTGRSEGISAMAFYVLSYVPAVIAAYAVVGVVERSASPFRRGERSIEGLHGLWSSRPLTAIALAVAMASLAGLPPTIGFWAKFDVFLASYNAGHLGLLIIALVNSFMGAYYYVRVIRAAFSDGDDPAIASNKAPEFSERSGAIFEVVAVIASLLVIVSGIMPNTMLRAAEIAAGVLR